MKTFKSDLSNSECPISERVSGRMLRSSLLGLVQKDYPQFTVENFLSRSELDHYREAYIEHFLKKQVGKISKLEKNGNDPP